MQFQSWSSDDKYIVQVLLPAFPEEAAKYKEQGDVVRPAFSDYSSMFVYVGIIESWQAIQEIQEMRDSNGII